jgi:hypothetical protein
MIKSVFTPGRSQKRRCLLISKNEEACRRVLLKRAFGSKAVLLCRPRSFDRAIRRVREARSEALKQVQIKYVTSWKDLVMFGSSIHMIEADVDVLIVDDFSSFFPYSDQVAGAVLETVSALCDATSFMKSDLMIGLIDENLSVENGDRSTPEKRSDRDTFIVSTCERLVKLFASHVLISEYIMTTTSSNNKNSMNSSSSSRKHGKHCLKLSLETRLGETEIAQCNLDYEK